VDEGKVFSSRLFEHSSWLLAISSRRSTPASSWLMSTLRVWPVFVVSTEPCKMLRSPGSRRSTCSTSFHCLDGGRFTRLHYPDTETNAVAQHCDAAVVGTPRPSALPPGP
jgi:hypothetical protein